MYSQNSNSQVVVNHIKKRKKDLIKVFHSKCCICGFDKFPQALQFHHVYPEQKSFGITDSNSVTKALDKQLIEMKKCILVCANCHRGIHQGYYSVPKNYQQLYDDNVANQLLKDLNEIKHGKKRYCQRCNKIIATKNKYCEQCRAIILKEKSLNERKAKRPSRDQLKNLIRTLPFTTIAKNFNVSDNAIRKWCDLEKLPRKKTQINKYSEEEWKKI